MPAHPTSINILRIPIASLTRLPSAHTDAESVQLREDIPPVIPMDASQTTNAVVQRDRTCRVDGPG